MEPLIRRRLVCRGAVQGVGFRPAVHRLATGLGLAGSVRNDGEGATIEVEGRADEVARFEERLASSLPPLSRLAGIDASDVAPGRATGFRVAPSARGARRRALVPPDAALCTECRAELEDPGDRRHRYPFTTCASCGPRFTLVRALPYDRARTSMAPFPPCPQCAREYGDVGDRRFHTETVCCPHCGPRLRFVAGEGSGVAAVESPARALGHARECLAHGDLIALKGLGGFQIACRADMGGSVERLRRVKRRPTRPFALMTRDLAAARRLVQLDIRDEDLLLSARSPILLAARRAGAPVAASVAPGLDDLGVMLPTTPLHAELFRDAPYDTLVMTSGNASDEPIARTDSEALSRLGPMVDRLLLHDREVVRRADDSVARSTRRGPVVVRRSRGYVPEPLPLPVASPEPVLALGAHLQVTACLGVAREAFPSQHVGDLDTETARAFLREVADGLEDFLQVRPRTLVVDLHPDYASTLAGEELAQSRGGSLLRVQHHLAHAAGVLAEHGRFPAPGERALAVVLDGTGLGTDGTLWGAEWLVVEGDLRWKRVASSDSLPLVGGERAVAEPWRVAAAALAQVEDLELLVRTPLAAHVPADRLQLVGRLAHEGDWPLASGAGRVFEAAAALLGLCPSNSYEGEAAARLEAAAARAPHASAARAWPEVTLRGARDGELPRLPAALLLAAVAARVLRGAPVADVAAGFHATFCALIAELTERVLPQGVRAVALGGGCLVNRLLADGVTRELRRRDLEALLPCALPPGDGGLAYGQAALAAVALAHGCSPVERQPRNGGPS